MTTAILWIGHIIQLMFLVSIIILKELTQKKALVMRHVYQRREFYEGVMTQFNLVTIITLLLFITFCFVVYLYSNCHKNKVLNKELLLLAIISIVFLCIIQINYFQGIMVYYYLVVMMLLMLGIEWILVTIVMKTH